MLVQQQWKNWISKQGFFTNFISLWEETKVLDFISFSSVFFLKLELIIECFDKTASIGHMPKCLSVPINNYPKLYRVVKWIGSSYLNMPIKISIYSEVFIQYDSVFRILWIFFGPKIDPKCLSMAVMVSFHKWPKNGVYEAWTPKIGKQLSFFCSKVET